jgi:hypothetical protein
MLLERPHDRPVQVPYGLCVLCKIHCKYNTVSVLFSPEYLYTITRTTVLLIALLTSYLIAKHIDNIDYFPPLLDFSPRLFT